MRVEVEDLKRHFGKTKAVDGISFGFVEGQIFGFVGPNGAGKTTAMRILATLDEPTGGDALVDGVSVVLYPEKGRRLIGFVPDSLPTHRDITVHEYLDFFARAYGLPRRERVPKLEALEEFTNLLGIREKLVNALSKGMKQRVSLARALVHDPPVLVMDEPAAGLDPRARIELRELLKILADQGKAILISSHILTELAEIVHGAVIIEHGKLLHAGTLDEIQAAVAEAHGAGRRVISLRPIDRREELAKELLLMPFVEDVKPLNAEIAVEIEDTDDAAWGLLQEILQRGYRIIEYRQRRAQLEDVFMRATKGEVS